MNGDLDPLYVIARRVLLDALEAIRPHLEALVLVGSQAVYLHAGDLDLAISPYTTDGDVALDPRRLGPEPRLEAAMKEAGFELTEGSVGIWQAQINLDGEPRAVSVDLLVPESLGGAGRRAARIPPHARGAARKVSGLEGALVDRDLHLIAALEPSDKREFETMVAGPAALLVAKVHKIIDRASDMDRRSDKDALDIYRLLRGIPTKEIGRRLRMLQGDPLSRQVAETTIIQLPELFGRLNAPGTQMAVRAAQPFEEGETLAASLIALTQDLLVEIQENGE